MKKQIKSFRILVIAICAVLSIASFANNHAEDKAELFVCFDSVFNYQWNSHNNATSYSLEIINQGTQETYNWTTSATSISAFNVTSGTYDLKLIGHTSSGSSFIITEDTIVH